MLHSAPPTILQVRGWCALFKFNVIIPRVACKKGGSFDPPPLRTRQSSSYVLVIRKCIQHKNSKSMQLYTEIACEQLLANLIYSIVIILLFYWRNHNTIPPATAAGIMNAEAIAMADQQNEHILHPLAHLYFPAS